jgi:hypothetical protein
MAFSGVGRSKAFIILAVVSRFLFAYTLMSINAWQKRPISRNARLGLEISLARPCEVFGEMIRCGTASPNGEDVHLFDAAVAPGVC